MSVLIQLREKMREQASPQRAESNAWFFKTGPGEYGEGDQFIGLTVPQLRLFSKQYRSLTLPEIESFLHSPIHEERLLALFILVGQYQKASDTQKKTLFTFYMSHTTYINNWDLVDCSASHIVGPYLDGKGTAVLLKLAHSKIIWERRIAMIATLSYIVAGRSTEALEIAEVLVNDRHDLIQKAVGWMLREVGKRCGKEIEEEFLKKHYRVMPRTMLRYAIERFPEDKRKYYMNKTT